MSTYKPDSQLSQVNAHAFERPVQVDADIIDVVTTALEYSRISNGAFDITYASVGYLYDYRAHQHPPDAQIAAALPGVDYRQLKVDPVANTIRFLQPGMRIDLGGIAKGWSVDRGVEILRRMGIEHATLNLRYFDGESWLDEWDSTVDANSLPVAMEVDIQVAYKTTNPTSTQGDPTRRLVQSFAIPCGGEALTETESETTTAETESETTTAGPSTGPVGG